MVDQRFSRKDLKQQDDFQRSAVDVASWIIERRKAIGLVLLVVVAAGSVLAGVRAYQARQEENAAALLATGLRIYGAPVIDDPDLDPAVAAALSDGDNYSSESAKYEAAIAAFGDVIEQYGSQPSGRAAYFYLGTSLLALERNDEAIAALEQAGTSSTPLVQAMALYRLGSLYSTLGQHAEAAATFERLGDNPPVGFPADEARFATAQAQEAAGDAQAALMTYRAIADGDAASLYAMPARVRAEELAARLGVELDSES
jgi:tetratricopeptide (TPR) repeat protein